MKYYLTSSPCLNDGRLNPANQFVSSLRKDISNAKSCLFIAAYPKEEEMTARFAKELRNSFERSGFYFTDFTILQEKNKKQAKELINKTDLIILSGGHVPTQHKFFQDIGLRKALKHYEGVVIGISAGSMNAAETVYSQPELEGEAIDKDYQRFFQGLGLTKCNILPHYNELAGTRLDGKLLYEEITAEDSIGKEFYVFVDGTYLTNTTGKEEIRGEAYLIKDKTFNKICSLNKTVDIS